MSKENKPDTFWIETMSFRWVRRYLRRGLTVVGGQSHRKKNFLQQKWRLYGTEETEWRDIPVEKEN